MCKNLLSDEEYRALQFALGLRPDQGVVIPGDDLTEEQIRILSRLAAEKPQAVIEALWKVGKPKVA